MLELADQISLIGAGKLVISGQVQDIAACAGFGRCSTFTLTPAQDSRLKLSELLHWRRRTRTQATIRPVAAHYLLAPSPKLCGPGSRA